MKTLLLVYVFAAGLIAAPGCAGDLANDGASAEKKESAVVYYQTVPGHNKAEYSGKYSCAGWTYRMLFGWEQHQDPASPTGWYAAIGPSSPSTTGTLTSGVSADVYLQCYWGIILSPSGTFSDGTAFNDRLYADLSSNPIPCTITTVWPASWRLSNPVLPVQLNQYDYVPPRVPGTNGVLYLDIISGYPPGDPGKGWCGRGWFGGQVIDADTLPVPTVPGPPLCSASDFAPGCAVDPPCGTTGEPACPPSPPAPI